MPPTESNAPPLADATPPPTASEPPPPPVSSDAAADKKPSANRSQAYGGLALSPFTIEGLADIHASDWQDYGLGGLEGRIALPLGKGNTSGPHWGGRLGYRLPSAFPLLGEIGVYPGTATLLTLAIGADIHPLKTKAFSLGVTPKVGYLVGIVDLGKAQVLPGKTPPVITRAGTFNEGDAVSATMAGPFIQAGASACLRLFGPFGLRADAGYQLAFMGDFKVKAGNVDLDKDAPALVKPDGSATQAGVDPKAKANGLYGFVGLTYEL